MKTNLHFNRSHSDFSFIILWTNIFTIKYRKNFLWAYQLLHLEDQTQLKLWYWTRLMSFLVFWNSEKNFISIPTAYFVVSAIDAFHEPKPNDKLTKTIQSTGLQKTRGLLNDNQRMPSKTDGNKIRNLESVQPKPWVVFIWISVTSTFY